MKISKSIRNVFIYILVYLSSHPPLFVICSSLEVTIDNHSPNNLKSKATLVEDKLSDQMINSIKLHGILLWVSMGFLMPLGILFIRMANKTHENGRKVKVFFYLHVIFQILAVVLATIGAIMSLRTLENAFDNNHQRLGLAAYATMWLQSLTGVFKPSRGSKSRMKWYLLHWILGTIVSIVGIINIYTGIRAYQKKTSSNRDSSLWTILFTAQITCLVFFYLFQDKWEHFQKQRVALDELDHQIDNNHPNGNNHQNIQVVTRNDDHEQHKVMVPQPCRKSNALVNLFKLI